MKLVNKIVTLVIFLWIGSVFAVGQINEKDAQGRKQGQWAQYWKDSDVLRYEGKFKNDKPVGKFRYYYPSSKIRAIILHKENSNRSEAYFYHENEKLASFGIYRNEEKDSVWTQFTETGDLSYKETYRRGKLNGERTVYYESEVAANPNKVLIFRKENYKNGEIHGKFTEYFPDGKVKKEGEYVNGKLEGKVKEYHPNGKMMALKRYKNQKKHGWWILYDKQGKEDSRRYFRMGQTLEGEVLNRYLEKLKKEGKNPND